MLNFLQWTIPCVLELVNSFFSLYLNIRRLRKKSWKTFRGGPSKSWFFLSVKEWEL